jgi:glycosyltransferase involved in cell wall biosynthesis
MNPDLSKGPVSVILNVHNEADTIEREILEIHRQILSKLPGSELIVAEDGSTDGTKEIIAKFVRDFGVIHSTGPQRKGYAKALKDALGLAKHPYIFFSDTGGKFDYADFWKLYAMRRRYALIIGVREKRSDPLPRRFLTFGYNFLLRRYFHVPLRDADSGFRILRRDLAQKIRREEWINRYLINAELTLRAVFSGYSVGYVPVAYRGRRGRSRGLPPWETVRAVVHVLKNFPRLKSVLSSASYSRNGR